MTKIRDFVPQTFLFKCLIPFLQPVDATLENVLSCTPLGYVYTGGPSDWKISDQIAHWVALNIAGYTARIITISMELIRAMAVMVIF